MSHCDAFLDYWFLMAGRPIFCHSANSTETSLKVGYILETTAITLLELTYHCVDNPTIPE